MLKSIRQGIIHRYFSGYNPHVTKTRHILRQNPCYYHENIVDHYENPRNVGSLNKNSRNVGTGLVGAPACGDVMKVQIQVDEDGRIIDAKFKTFGCGSAIASSSVATEWIKNRLVDQCMTITVSFRILCLKLLFSHTHKKLLT